MGLYFEWLSTGEPMHPKDKATQMIKDGATPTQPLKWEPRLVCVIENGPFDAAGWCYNHREFVEFQETPRDRRRRTWLVATQKQMDANHFDVQRGLSY